MNEEQEVLLEMLDIIRDKVKRGDCTKRQTDVAYDAALNILDVYATSDELAKHFGKSVDAVHGVIKRRMIAKPKKNVTLYSFREFLKCVPNKWLHKKK